MPNYRRAGIAGGTYFFTVNTFRRLPVLTEAPVREALRKAIFLTRLTHLFDIDAWVLLPDHLHCIWTLPRGDADFSLRWAKIKRMVSKECGAAFGTEDVSASRTRRNEAGLWQRRFWEHLIRDDEDFARHADYIHWNPVKHGLVVRTAEWPYSTFHRFVREGVYPADWGRAEGSGFIAVGEPA
jgi:putative transposase